MRDINGLVQKATGQQGLLTTTELRAFGLTKGRQGRLMREGLLVAVRKGVVRLGGSNPTWEQRLLAAILTPGAPIVASHRAALRRWGLWSRFDGLEVAVRRPHNRTLPGVTVHRSVDLQDDDCVVVDGIPVTTVARTLCDSGLIFPEHEVQRQVDHAIATDLVTPTELIAVRRRVGEHGRNGVVKLGAAVDGLPTGAMSTESGPETALLRILTQAGLPTPIPQFEVRVGARRYRLDLAFPEARLGLEYDGVDPHTRVDRFVADRRRQNDLADIGWTICRYTHPDLRDRPGAIIAQVRRHLRHL
jgi:very-short-patch-repair endonuclease